MLSRIVGMVLVWITIITVMASSAPMIQYWDLPSLIMPIFLSIGILVARFGKKAFRWEDQKHRDRIIEEAIKALIVSAFFGVFLGLHIIFMNMDDPSKIGPGLAVCITPAVYTSMAILTLLALKSKEMSQRPLTKKILRKVS